MAAMSRGSCSPRTPSCSPSLARPPRPNGSTPREADALLDAQPDANVAYEQAVRAVERAVAGLDELAPELERITREHADALLASHQRVREGARAAGTVTVQPQLPPDVLGTYVLLPAGED